MKHTLVARFAALTAWLVLAVVGGCQQQQQAQAEPTPSERQARLIAAENIRLKEQLADRDKQMETLRREHARELKQRDQELAACKARNEKLQKDVETGIAERVRDVMAAVVEENARLRRQIEELRTEIENLKAQPDQQIP
jgi:DNA anti-recombination protein RmuC